MEYNLVSSPETEKNGDRGHLDVPETTVSSASQNPDSAPVLCPEPLLALLQESCGSGR